MSRTANQTTHLTKSKRSLPKSALSPTEQAVNALLEVLTKTKTAMYDVCSDGEDYVYSTADRIKAAEIILKYAPEKRAEMPQN